jgi:hypothetical protein
MIVTNAFMPHTWADHSHNNSQRGPGSTRLLYQASCGLMVISKYYSLAEFWCGKMLLEYDIIFECQFHLVIGLPIVDTPVSSKEGASNGTADTQLLTECGPETAKGNSPDFSKLLKCLQLARQLVNPLIRYECPLPPLVTGSLKLGS